MTPQTTDASRVLIDRCAHCLRPSGSTIQNVGVYTPNGSNEPVAYALCESCAGRFRRSAGKQNKKMLARIEAYITG